MYKKNQNCEVTLKILHSLLVKTIQWSAVIHMINMADNSTEKGPWRETLESFVRYVALNPKEFILYGN